MLTQYSNGSSRALCAYISYMHYSNGFSLAKYAYIEDAIIMDLDFLIVLI
jgi:hypothetical protein